MDQNRFQPIENLTPYLKRVELISSEKDIEISNISYFSRDSIFPFQENHENSKIII